MKRKKVQRNWVPLPSDVRSISTDLTSDLWGKLFANRPYNNNNQSVFVVRMDMEWVFSTGFDPSSKRNRKMKGILFHSSRVPEVEEKCANKVLRERQSPVLLSTTSRGSGTPRWTQPMLEGRVSVVQGDVWSNWLGLITSIYSSGHPLKRSRVKRNSGGGGQRWGWWVVV